MAPVNSKWRIAAIVLVFVVLAQGLELHHIKSALSNVFHYDVEVTVKDKNTGKILEGVITHSSGTSSQDIFHQSTRFGGGLQSRKISGIAYQPREFGFSANGYKSESIVVYKDTKESIAVELEPMDPNAEP